MRRCKLGDEAFRTLCDSEVIEADGTDWIPAFLGDRRGEPAVAPFDKSLLFPAPEAPSSDGLPDCACMICSGSVVGPNFETSRNAKIIEHYTRAQDSAKADILPAPVLMLGEDVHLDPEMFLVEGNRIHVLGKEAPAPVNFAACQGGPRFPDAEDFITPAAKVGVAHFLVPPILFAETADTYHLKFDFFRNTWMAKHEQSTVTVPMIRPFDMDETGYECMCECDCDCGCDEDECLCTDDCEECGCGCAEEDDEDGEVEEAGE
ncbi:hypothetical protein GCM10023178_24110 [Actinomadura luteofluorescens]